MLDANARLPQSRQQRVEVRSVSPSVEISFVEGFERDWRMPKSLRAAGLNRRVAVVQETAVRECPDMYFDEALFLALIDFVAASVPGARLGLADRVEDVGRRELARQDLLAGWARLPATERDPAGAVVARLGERPVMAIVTEFWVSAGGPRPYADSYTYSVLSDRRLGDALRAFLAARPEAERWIVTPAVLDHPVAEDPARQRSGWLGRLFG
ncbi:MAG: hypothetical protein EON85_15775 [Brevundimonas sp.]|nr:MAG: hypothetical protein EON85_15775 [Brevundimonas sp.]